VEKDLTVGLKEGKRDEKAREKAPYNPLSSIPDVSPPSQNIGKSMYQDCPKDPGG